MSFTNALLKMENVSFRYPKSDMDALSCVNLEIPEGSFFALLGPNGAGKTTLLRLLCGRFDKFLGSIKIADKLRAANGFLDMTSCGILLENPGVYPKLSIAEYLDYFIGFYASCQANWNRSLVQERVLALAKRLELPSLKTRMSALSLGNRQKVQLLRALAPNPQLLILDEPVANLDPMAREAVWNILSDWRKNEGGTAIVCSHILAEMEKMATDYAIINYGRMLCSGRVDDISVDVSSFIVNASAGVTLEQISAALHNAGLEAEISPAPVSLSKLYRETV
ncbi:ABC transporter ATP-binding protein [uncultured Fibrobacter sp.]|uniref:ABC transporter ATP-binding protein n=1 Tax=uncultured Fibrobacter sp. TaxID=261512 RepID=UPI00263880B5|nr:ABC transporter ATP-binding protein [uncultured Fibrobacter sp.]